MNKKIIINSGTGLIGKYFIRKSLEKGYSPIVLSRDSKRAREILSDFHNIPIEEFNPLNNNKNISEIINNAYAVVNFSGATISKRKWTEEYKKILISSRVDVTKALISQVQNCQQKPEVFINMSAIGYYGYQKGIVATEETPKGEGFIPDLCDLWEKSAFKAKELEIRTVVLRAGIVLTEKGGALGRMIPLFKFFLGGVLGSGTQYMPWIHIEDLANLIIFSIENKNVEGVLNATSPHQITNRELTKTLAKVFKRPAIFKVPTFILKIALGDFAINVLEGIQVLPEKTLSYGFKFRFDNLESALYNLFKK